MAATFIAYLPAMRGEFIWDDDAYVTQNRNLRTPQGLVDSWMRLDANPQYYPLVFSTFWIEYRLWGLSPTGYHVVNVLLHIAASLLLWQLLRLLGVPGACLVGALFAIHPVHVESVAWITERKNVLSTLLYLASAWCLLVKTLGVERDQGQEGRWWTAAARQAWYLLALLLFVGALLSKTVTSSLPAAVLVVLWWKQGKIRTRQIVSLVPFFVIGIGMGLLTAWLEQKHVGATGEEWNLSLVERSLVAGRALWFYVAKLIWPVGLSFNYERWTIRSEVWWQHLYPLCAVGVVASLWAFRRRIGRGPLAAVLFFSGTLFPALGFLNVYPFRYSYVADHFQYLASVGLLTLAGGSTVWWLSRRGRIIQRAGMIAAAVVLVLLGVQTWRRGHAYADSVTLWEDTLTKNPTSYLANYNLGCERMRLKQVKSAMSHFRAAIAAKPGVARHHYSLGKALVVTAQIDEAIEQFRKSIEYDPNYLLGHNNLGVVLEHYKKDYPAAAERFRDVIRIDPNVPLGHVNLGRTLLEMGQIPEAIAELQHALRLDQTDDYVRQLLEHTEAEARKRAATEPAARGS